MQDKILVNQILNKDKKAVEQLYRLYSCKLLDFISQKIPNHKDAEEILNDVFISSLDSLPIFNFKSSLGTWMIGIAKHEVVDYYRKKRIKTLVFSHFPFLEKIVDRALGPELALQEKETKTKIFKSLKSLSEGYCQILRLKYIDGLSMAEISKVLKITVKAVESRLFRARLAFKKEYEGKTQSLFKKDWKILNSSFNQGELSF